MNKTIIVTGETNTTGLEIIKKFLKNNDKVIIASVDPDDVIKKKIKELSQIGEISIYKCNISSDDDCYDIVDEILFRYGHIDMLLNILDIKKQDDDVIHTHFKNVFLDIQTNLMGIINISHIVSLEMIKQKSGTIMNVNFNNKAIQDEVYMLTKSLSNNLAHYGIEVLSIDYKALLNQFIL
jgi:3-oxoacyl-[acyl-carrier protein] reductase